MLTIKVGMFPGTLKEVVIEEGTKVSEVLEMAGITVGAEQEIKLDDEVVNASDAIEGGKMLLVTKRIKGQF